jgi:uridylate kinase
VKVVIRVGGSVVASPPNPKLMSQYVDLLKELKAQKHEVVAVVGGGSLARDFIRVAGEMGLSESDKDWVAIFVSRLFALLFVMRLGDLGCGKVPVSIDEAVECFKRGKVVVMGGLKPGMTTDAVAAMIAGGLKVGLLVKATDQEGIYTKDPDKFPEATKIDEISFEDLFALLEEDKHKAGIQQILDPVAVRVLQKSRIRTVVVNGFKPKNILSVLKGEKIGTTIS